MAAVLVLAAGGLGALVLGGARAATTAAGDLTPIGCVASSTGGGPSSCASKANLGGANGIAITSDGKNAYVVSAGSHALEVMVRDSAGKLTPNGCLGDLNNGPANCNRVPGLSNAFAVAVSPDGADVYAVSRTAFVLRTFARDVNGALTTAGCIGDVKYGMTGCSNLGRLIYASGLAVSPDGKNVYALGDAGDVNELSRGTNGALTFLDCLGVRNCGVANGIAHPQAIAVSPDGKNVYVGSSYTVAEYTREASGKLAPLACYTVGSVTANCSSSSQFDNISAIVVSPDGQNVYVAHSAGDNVAIFARGPSGALTFAGCVGNAGAGATAGPRECDAIKGLEAPSGLAISPNGQSVYVAAHGSDDVAIFARSASGGLTSTGCVGSPALDCVATDGVSSPTSVVVSPDGQNVYVTSGVGAVTSFARTTSAGTTTTTAATTATTTTTTAPATTTVTKPAPTKTPKKVVASLVYATVTGQRETRLLSVRLHVTGRATVAVKLLGKRAATLGSMVFSTPGGTRTFAQPVKSGVARGPHLVKITVTAAGKTSRTFTPTVLVPS